MTSVTPEILDVVRQLKGLTDTDSLGWSESRGEFLRGGGLAVEVAMASGRWRITLTGDRRLIRVQVRDRNDSLIYDFTVPEHEGHFAELRALHEAALESKRRRASKSLEEMRQELSARAG